MVANTDLSYYDFRLDRDTLSNSLGGGIPEGAIILITGNFGTGKSVLCQRFSFGFVENGSSVSYVSSETNTKPFMDQMESLDYPIKDYIYDEQLKLIPVYPLIGQTCSREEKLSKLIESDKLFERDITIIDTLSSLIKDTKDKNLSLKALEHFKRVSSRGKSVFLTLDPDEINKDMITPYKSTADVHLDLKRKTIGNEVQRTINIRRFTTSPGRMQEIIKFRIEPNAGFIVDITQVA